MAMVGGWKKNFLRRKQQADQLIGRAEKSEVISDYQQEKEKRAETIRQVCKGTRQKLGEYARVNDGDFDKRLKKMPEYGISQSMLESAAALGQDTLLGDAFQVCSGAAETIAREHVQMLVDIENDVCKPMQEIENDVKGIVADKKHLNNVTLDMDAARTRFHSAVKQTQSTVAAKLDVLRDEMDESSTKVEQARDTFATNLYNFATKEPEYGKLLLHWAEAQRRFHKEALQQLEKLIPELEKCIEDRQAGGVYGASLHEHLRRSNRKIAYVMEVCIPALYLLGLQEEGLFRIAGGANKVKKLKAALDCRHDFVDLTEEFEDGRDVHTIAGALKLYLRELPEPLMTCESYDGWMAAAKSTGDQRLRELWEVLYSLPKENFENLEYLIKFLGKLSQHQEVNKMTPSNLAIVFGPNLLWPPSGGGPTVLTTGIQSAIVETLIIHADWFFPGDVDFRKDGRGSGADGQRSNAPASANILAQKTLPRSSHTVNSAMTSAHNTLMAPMSQGKNNSNSAPVSREASPGLKTAVGGPSPLGPSGLSASQESKSNSASPSSQPSGLHGSSNHGNSSSQVTPSPRLSNKDIRERFLEGKPVVPPSTGPSKSSPEQTAASRSEWQRRSWSERPSPYLSSHTFNGSNTSNLDSITRPKDKSDTFSDPGFLGSSTLGRSSARRSILSRATTPPPKPPPPKGVHSDVYNTVFALQALGDGWSDYLTRVRTLLDSNLTKSGSSDSDGSGTPTGGEAGAVSNPEQKQSSEPSGNEPKTDTASSSSSTSCEAKTSASSGSVGTGLGPKAGEAPQEVDYQLTTDSSDFSSTNGSEQPSIITSTPAVTQQSMTGSLYGNLNAQLQGVTPVAPTSPNLMSTSQYTPSNTSPQANFFSSSNMTASYHGSTLSAQQPSPTHKRTPSSPTGSMLSLNADGSGQGTLSRRGKKPAPLPPERPSGPAPPPPDKSPGLNTAVLNNVDTPEVTSAVANADKTADKPPIPERPHVPPPGPPAERPSVPEKPAFHPERPKVPPPERPVGRPPEKPEKPSVPSKPEVVKVEKSEVVSESKPEPSPKPDIITSTRPEPVVTLDTASKSDGTKPDVLVTKPDASKQDLPGNKPDVGKLDTVKLRDKSEGRPDRPDVPPQPFHRTSSGRPARPGPPPPPPPTDRQSSLEPRAPLAQAETEDSAADELPNTTTELTRL